MADGKQMNEVEVDLTVEQVLHNGEIVFRKDTPTLKVPKWLATSMVEQKVAKLKGVK